MKLKIIRDEHAENPRTQFDHFGTFFMKHRRYDFGDKGAKEIDPETFDGLVLPVFMNDHGGLTINITGFSCPWDSGQIGWIYISREKILHEFSRKKMSKKLLEQARKNLICEIEEIDHWLTGNVYGFETEDGDSCWGFYGDNPKTNGIAEHLALPIEQYEVEYS